MITLVGAISRAETEALGEAIKHHVKDLKPGFAVVTDLTLCRVGSLAGLGSLQRIMDFLVRSKVGPVVRVARHDQIIFRQLAQITDSFRSYRPLYVTTVEDAEATLKELVEKTAEVPCP